MKERIIEVVTATNDTWYIPQVKVRGLLFSCWRSITTIESKFEQTPSGLVARVESVSEIVSSQCGDENMSQRYMVDDIDAAIKMIDLYYEKTFTITETNVLDRSGEKHQPQRKSLAMM